MNKKETVLKVATQLFSQQGFDNTSMANICEKAGVSKGLVYHHFKSKDEILTTIFGDGTEQMKALNEAYLDNSPHKNLTDLIEGVFGQIVKEKELFKLNLNIMFQPSTRALLSKQIKQRSQMLFDYVKRNFAELDPKKADILSFMFIAEIDGISLDYLSVYDDYPIEDMKNHLIQRYKN